MTLTSSMDVLRNWPEWKAFSERLGISDAGSIAITIHLRVNEPVVITQEYYPKQKSEDDQRDHHRREGD